LRLTFFDTYTRIKEGYSARNGLHVNEEERDDLDNYMLELVYLILEDRQGVKCDNILKIGSTEGGIEGNETIISRRTEDFT
jgi:hypothetical protein